MGNYKVRPGVFETNSSSSHVIFVPSTNDELEHNPGFLDGEDVEITLSEIFGWDFRKIDWWHDKAKYLLTYYHTTAKGNGKRAKQTKKVIEDYTGCNLNVIDGGGSIDHQSIGRLPDLDREEIKQFIFGDGVFFGGNDNVSPPTGHYDKVKRYIDEADIPVVGFFNEEGNIIDMAKMPIEEEIQHDFIFNSSLGAVLSPDDVLSALVKEEENEDYIDMSYWVYDNEESEITINYHSNDGFESTTYDCKVFDNAEFD